MRYSTLASDYDGTLALDGLVAEPTVDAIRRFKEAGGRILLVTGRDVQDLKSVFPDVHLMDLVVAENGALIFDPRTGREDLLGPPVPAQLLEQLHLRGVTPILPGRVIVSTRQPFDVEVHDALRDLRLPYQVIYNKGAVMILPGGINKARGLEAALSRLAISPDHVVAVGDAENDHSLLASVGLGVAVSNALPALCDEADVVLDKPASAGVEQLISMMLDGDRRLVARQPTIGQPVGELAAAVAETIPGGR